MTERVLLRPSELAHAVRGYLTAYIPHGGEEAGFLEDELANDDAQELADPAVWDDWLQAVWAIRGIIVESPLEAGQHAARHPNSGSIGAVDVRQMRDSFFTGLSTLGNPTETSGTFSETAGFTILVAYITWIGWPRKTTWIRGLGRRDATLSARVQWLDEIVAGTAPQNLANLWAPFFVDDYVPDPENSLPLWTPLVEPEDPMSTASDPTS
jgi:hypothetical protein